MEESVGNSVDFAGLDISNSLLKKMCPKPPKCNFASKYRNLDGTCNSKVNPRFGEVYTPLQRVLPNAYADGKLYCTRNISFKTSDTEREVVGPRKGNIFCVGMQSHC